MTDFITRELIFDTDKIYFQADGKTNEVMMDWEAPIMQASAEYVTNSGSAKSILEIGFGMGISANYIQQYGPTTHTIIEAHPEIILRANDFAKNNEGVSILEGNWYDLVREGLLETYDGIFIDTYFDPYIEKFKEYYPQLLNKGGRMTWWNPMEDKLPSDNIRFQKNIEYQMIVIKNEIPYNSYHNKPIYWMPKIQL